MSEAERRRPRWIYVALGVLALHVLMSLRYVWEDASFVETWLRVSPDFVLLLSVGLVAGLGFGYHAIIGHAVAIGAVFVPLYRFGHSIMPVFYGKEFDPYDDISMIPGLVHLLTHRFDDWLQWVVLGAAAIAAVLFYVLVYKVVALVLRAGSGSRWSYGLLAVCQGVVIIGWVEASAGSTRASRVWGPGMIARALEDVAEIAKSGNWRAQELFEQRMSEAQSELARTPGDLARLDGADVYVLFVESYGAVLLRGRTNPVVHRWAAAFEERLQENGFSSCSAYMFPSVRGGLSSFAHAEFLSGMKIENRRVFDLLLESPLQSLPRFFNEAGYSTFNVQPATNREWPEGEFFGFQKVLFQPALPYSGREYHWGLMPDQFALNHVLETELANASEPVFLLYVAVTSHSPFSMIPRYYDDWSEASAPGAFRGEPEKVYDITWATYTSHPDVEKAYLDAIHYSLRTMVGFVEQLSRPSLVFIVGDHQPPRVKPLTDSDASYDVPIHVIANREHLLAPFLEHGFARGLVPEAERAPFSSSRFLHRFLRYFSGG